MGFFFTCDITVDEVINMPLGRTPYVHFACGQDVRYFKKIMKLGGRSSRLRGFGSRNAVLREKKYHSCEENSCFPPLFSFPRMPLETGF